jgi:hypothetical protein
MGGILGGGGEGGGGGFLGDLLGGLPDPLGIGKMLGIVKDEEKQPMGDSPMAGGAPPPLPAGVQYQMQQKPSGVSFDPSSMGNSPMGPTGFGIGGGGRR